MIITVRNTTKQARVYQLAWRVASGEFKGHSEDVLRVDHDASGNSEIRRKRLRHGPVLRLLAGEVKEIPAALLHDPVLRADTVGNRPPVKIVRRETPKQFDERKAEEKKAADKIARLREERAVENKSKQKHEAAAQDQVTNTGGEAAPEAADKPALAEKAGSDGEKSSSRPRRRGRGK